MKSLKLRVFALTVVMGLAFIVAGCSNVTGSIDEQNPGVVIPEFPGGTYSLSVDFAANSAGYSEGYWTDPVWVDAYEPGYYLDDGEYDLVDNGDFEFLWVPDLQEICITPPTWVDAVEGYWTEEEVTYDGYFEDGFKAPVDAENVAYNRRNLLTTSGEYFIYIKGTTTPVGKVYITKSGNSVSISYTGLTDEYIGSILDTFKVTRYDSQDNNKATVTDWNVSSPFPSFNHNTFGFSISARFQEYVEEFNWIDPKTEMEDVWVDDYTPGYYLDDGVYETVDNGDYDWVWVADWQEVCITPPTWIDEVLGFWTDPEWVPGVLAAEPVLTKEIPLVLNIGSKVIDLGKVTVTAIPNDFEDSYSLMVKYDFASENYDLFGTIGCTINYLGSDFPVELDAEMSGMVEMGYELDDLVKVITSVVIN